MFLLKLFSLAFAFTAGLFDNITDLIKLPENINLEIIKDVKGDVKSDINNSNSNSNSKRMVVLNDANHKIPENVEIQIIQNENNLEIPENAVKTVENAVKNDQNSVKNDQNAVKNDQNAVNTVEIIQNDQNQQFSYKNVEISQNQQISDKSVEISQNQQISQNPKFSAKTAEITQNEQIYQNQQEKKEKISQISKQVETKDQFKEKISQISKQVETKDQFKEKIITNNNPKKCYIITSDFLDKTKDFDNFIPKQIKFTYKNNLIGFTFCTENSIENFKEKFKMFKIEEDKLYRIASVENDKQFFKEKDFLRKNDINNYYRNYTNNYYTNYTNNYTNIIPLHMFRIYNLGNLLFNNYFLDNYLFRLFGINRLIKYFYNYKYSYTGANVKVTLVDTPLNLNGKSCNYHSKLMTKLISGRTNSFSKNTSVTVIDALDCNGTIELSKLLKILDSDIKTDILLLPLVGPYSDILNQIINQLSKKFIVIIPAGKKFCQISENIIKVGSVNRHGTVSSFSNSDCNNIYALGEEVLGFNGAGISSAIVTSAVALFLEKHPKSSLSEVLQFLRNNSISNGPIDILKVPQLTPDKEYANYTFYSLTDTFIFILLIFILIIGVIGGVWYYRMERRIERDEYVFLNSERF